MGCHFLVAIRCRVSCKLYQTYPKPRILKWDQPTIWTCEKKFNIFSLIIFNKFEDMWELNYSILLKKTFFFSFHKGFYKNVSIIKSNLLCVLFLSFLKYDVYDYRNENMLKSYLSRPVLYTAKGKIWRKIDKLYQSLANTTVMIMDTMVFTELWSLATCVPVSMISPKIHCYNAYYHQSLSLCT